MKCQAMEMADRVFDDFLPECFDEAEVEIKTRSSGPFSLCSECKDALITFIGASNLVVRKLNERN